LKRHCLTASNAAVVRMSGPLLEMVTAMILLMAVD
jgi:hypothetical protein